MAHNRSIIVKVKLTGLLKMINSYIYDIKFRINA